MFVRWTHFFATPANHNQYGRTKWHYTVDGQVTLCGLRIPSTGRPAYHVQNGRILMSEQFCGNCRRSDHWLANSTLDPKGLQRVNSTRDL